MNNYFMEEPMKRFFAFVAMLATSPLVFAETEIVSCESDLGKCTYTLSSESFSQECVCRDGSGIGENSDVTSDYALPTDDECDAELEKVCKNAGIKCENEAGTCTIKPNGEYQCSCIGIDDLSSGTGIFGENGCKDILEENCGTEAATPRTICTDSEIFNACVSYAQTFANTCYEPLTDEEIEALLDVPAESDVTARSIAQCCQDESMRNEYKTSFDCVKAAESCENKECCSACNVGGEDSAETGDKTPTDGETQTEDTADGDSAAPATDSEAPAENKEESKSDGCSMLFI
jgi:hypothetical protein